MLWNTGQCWKRGTTLSEVKNYFDLKTSSASCSCTCRAADELFGVSAMTSLSEASFGTNRWQSSTGMCGCKIITLRIEWRLCTSIISHTPVLSVCVCVYARAHICLWTAWSIYEAAEKQGLKTSCWKDWVHLEISENPALVVTLIHMVTVHGITQY